MAERVENKGARTFLWIVAILTVLVAAGALVWRLAGQRLIEAALTPTVRFEASPVAQGPDYALAANWLARPDLPVDPARWAPQGYAAAPKPPAAVFYIAPTAYLGRDRWNAPFDDKATNDRLALFTRSQASIFNGVAQVWAPRYRQATFGAFLTDKPDAAKAFELAYADVTRAFDAFLAAVPAGTPILLAGHSQGSMHLIRLLSERVAGQPIARRVVAAYVVGWPISVPADLPALGLPGCTQAGQSGCILSWSSWAEDNDPRPILEVYDRGTGFAKLPRKGTPMLCTNPLSGSQGTQAVPAERNLGTLVPNAELTAAVLEPRKVGAACDARGLLILNPTPDDMGPYVLPGGNFHVYDYALFWANLRADVEARLAGFGQGRLPATAVAASE